MANSRLYSLPGLQGCLARGAGDDGLKSGEEGATLEAFLTLH